MRVDPEAPSSATLLIHDGELVDIRSLLQEIAPHFVERLGPGGSEEPEEGWDLILATPQRMLDLCNVGSPKRIAILEKDSRTLRSVLRRDGIDFIVPRPVHPAALRLLLVHSLYRGPERRRLQRVSVGGTIRYRVGVRRRSGLLADLSMGGCRLLSLHSLAAGQSLKLQIPASLTRERPLSLRGTVLRCAPAEGSPSGTHAIAVRFKDTSSKERERLKATVQTFARGPMMHRGETAPTPVNPNPCEEPEPKAEPTRSGEENRLGSEESPADDAVQERRGSNRHQLERRIIALNQEATRVLLGRDISLGGMRVDPNPTLSVGDELEIALHVRARKVPLVVTARVDRDDGDDGMLLRFHDLTDSASEYLKKMVNLLPILASREGGDDAGVIVSEILELGSSQQAEE